MRSFASFTGKFGLQERVGGRTGATEPRSDVFPGTEPASPPRPQGPPILPGGGAGAQRGVPVAARKPPPGPEPQGRPLRRGDPRGPPTPAPEPRQAGLGRAVVAQRVGRHRLGRGAPLHLRGGVWLRRDAAAHPLRHHDVRRRAPQVRHASPEAALPAAHVPGRGFLVPGVFRTRLRLRPRLAQDARGLRGHTLRGERPEDLDHARAFRRLDVLPGAHRFRGEKAGRHLFPAGRHEDPGHHGAPAQAHGRRPRSERGVLRRCPRPGREPGAPGRAGLDRRQVPARARAHGHRAHRRLEARARKAQGARRDRAQGRQAPHRGRALPRPPHAGRGGAHGARSHEPALPRPAARGSGARRGGLDAQGPRHRDPAGPHRARDGRAGPARATGARARWRRVRHRRGRTGAALLQLPQDLDLRRLQRDPAQHHRQAEPRTLMKFDYSEEQRLVADSVRRFVAQDYAFEARRKILASGAGWSEGAWAKLAEIGLLGLPFDSDYGGFGRRAVDLMSVMEAFGDALVVEPYLATVLGGRFVARGAAETRKREILPAIAEGRLRMAFAHGEEDARYDLARVATRAKKVSGGYVIDGRKRAVLQAPCANLLVVSARMSGADAERAGISLFLVDAAAVAMTPYAMLDGTRGADVDLKGVQVAADALIGPEGGAIDLIEEVTDFALALLCAEAVGAMNDANEATLEYLKTRRQFGVPIGSFQALQHRMVDMVVECEHARALG